MHTKVDAASMNWDSSPGLDLEGFGHGSAAYNLLSACIQAAPNGYCQGLFSQLYNELQKDAIQQFESPREQAAYVMRGLANRLIDGLCYGNWPGRPMP